MRAPKHNQLAITTESLEELRHSPRLDRATVEWVTQALQLVRLTETQLRAVEILAAWSAGQQRR